MFLRGKPEKSGQSGAELDTDKYLTNTTLDKGGKEGTGKMC